MPHEPLHHLARAQIPKIQLIPSGAGESPPIIWRTRKSIDGCGVTLEFDIKLSGQSIVNPYSLVRQLLRDKVRFVKEFRIEKSLRNLLFFDRTISENPNPIRDVVKLGKGDSL